MFIFLYNWIINKCRRHDSAYILNLCRTGDIIALKQVDKTKINSIIETCLDLAICNFNKNIAEYLFSIGAKPTTDQMKIVCEKNKLEMVELLLKNGIEPKVVHRYATSPNILRMAFRFENKSEIVN